MNLLKADEVFFIRLTTTAAVKKIIKAQNQKSIMKNIMIRNNIRNNQKKQITMQQFIKTGI